MLIEHISVSRKSTYDLCELSYKYRYDLKIASPEPEPPYFGYGKVCHKIFETYVREKGSRDVNEIAKDVLSGAIELEPGRKAPQLSLDYRQKLPKHIHSFMRLTERLGVEGEVEVPFLIDLDPPHGRRLKGFIDRIIHHGDEYWIIDYKTTKKGPWRKNAKDIVHDLQLQAYCRVVMREYGADPAKIRAALYYLDGGNLIGAQFSKETLLQAEAKLLACYKDIEERESSAARANVGPHCQRCDYRRVCPFFTPSSKPWE